MRNVVQDLINGIGNRGSVKVLASKAVRTYLKLYMVGFGGLKSLKDWLKTLTFLSYQTLSADKRGSDNNLKFVSHNPDDVVFIQYTR
jgi:hypothetical protein